MSTPLKRLRRTMPYLTPPFVGEDDIPKIWRLGDPLLSRPPVESPPEIVPPVLTRTIEPPAPSPIAPSMPTRISDEELNQIGAPPPLLRRSMGEPLPNVAGAPPLPSWDAGEVLTRDSRDPYGELSPPPIPSRLASMAPPPVMMLSRGGHPVSAVGGIDALDADRQLLRTQQAEQPQRESKKHLIARILLGQLRGGLVGQGGSLDTLLGLGGVMDRRGLDRSRINQNIATTQGRIGQDLLIRKTQNDLLNDETERGYKAAQTAKALREPITRDMRVGDRILRQNSDGSYTPVYDAPEKSATERRPLLRGVTAPDGSTRTLKSTDNGTTWEEVPELQGAPKPNDGPSPAVIDQNIAELQSQIEKLGPPPPTEIDDTQWDSYEQKAVVVGKKVNPAYVKWAEQYDSKAKEIRELKMKRKAPPALTRGGKYAGQRISRAKLPEAAKRLGLSESEAEALIKKEGGAIY